MRGLAILGIMLHNYCHWLGLAVKENEYTYTQANVDRLVHVLSSPDANLPIHLLSFFGHYGVPVFLFLSAYGLTMKYELGGAEERVVPFLKKHFVKLFTMMIVGFTAFVLVDNITPGRHHYHLLDVVAQLGLFNNLLPSPDHIIWPGPYWFFGLMMQLYIVYRLLFYKRHWSLPLVAVAVCFLLQCFCAPEGDTLNRLRYNCIGGMLPFCAGILYARSKQLNTYPRWLYAVGSLFALVMVFGGSLDFQMWFWVPLAVIAATVCMVKALPESSLPPLCWLGSISAAMFVSHPITRKILIPISRSGDVYTGLLLYVVASIVVAILFKRIMSKA